MTDDPVLARLERLLVERRAAAAAAGLPQPAEDWAEIDRLLGELRQRHARAFGLAERAAESGEAAFELRAEVARLQAKLAELHQRQSSMRSALRRARGAAQVAFRDLVRRLDGASPAAAASGAAPPIEHRRWIGRFPRREPAAGITPPPTAVGTGSLQTPLQPIDPALADILPDPMAPPPGRWSYAAAEARPTLAVLAFGVESADLRALIDAQVRALDGPSSPNPVWITDCTDLSSFRTAGVAVEYLPPRASMERLAPDLDWHDAVARRAALLWRRWRPAAAIVLGEPPPFPVEILLGRTA